METAIDGTRERESEKETLYGDSKAGVGNTLKWGELNLSVEASKRAEGMIIVGNFFLHFLVLALA